MKAVATVLPLARAQFSTAWVCWLPLFFAHFLFPFFTMRILLVSLLSFAFLVSAKGQSVFHPDIMKQARATGSLFPFGVASADPDSNSVVLWTKVLPEKITDTLRVHWTVATDTTLQNVVGGGSLLADSASAFSIQVEQQGLEPHTTYYFCFFTSTDSSAVGRTKTASAGAEELRFAIASCAYFEKGYFNAYGHIAQRNDIDAVLFLGDYIYEYEPRSGVLREHIPSWEVLTLQDYRSRYAQYRLDTNLMEAHRLHPFITIWDDHEFADNTYKDGAKNHRDDMKVWEKRKANARQAFFEWIPIRRQPLSNQLYRKLNYGLMADMFMIDGRIEGRSMPVPHYLDSLRYDTSRTMLGATQRGWLKQGLVNSKTRWRVLVNDVMFAPIDLGSPAKDRRFNMDAWDGYEGDRTRILNVIEQDSVRNLIVVTGDIHTAWAIEITRNPTDPNVYNRRTGKGVIGAEFVTPSITSPNLDEMSSKLAAKLAVPYLKARKRNPHLRYANMMDHGYMVLHLTRQEAKATWVFMRSIVKPSLKTKRSHSWVFPYNGLGLERRKP